MRDISLLFLALIFPTICLAGIETVLVEERHGDCTVRVIHDAVPSFKNGTILFRTFRIVDGLQDPCAVTRSQVTDSLGKGVAKYISLENLKPASSIMVGKIGQFPWVKSDWLSRSQSGTYKKMSISDFDALVGAKAISQPFRTALATNGLEFDGARCEKIQFFDNGYPKDALCWFKIKGT